MNDSNELKKKLVKMMKWFHDFCVENNLKYYAAGGTMLGAIRHEGFIPWDDDIDVLMPRKDYNILSELLANPVENYVLETPNTQAKDFYYPFSKLYDTTTTLVENTKYKIRRGIYIDIFPLDGFGMTKEESLKNFNKTKMIYNLLLSKVTGINKNRNLLKNLAVICFKLIPINPKYLLRKLTKKCEEIDWEDSLWGGNPVGAWRFKEIMPKSVMGTPRLYRFEDIEIYGAENADEYLTRLYGNWRELPPENKRCSHHDYIELDLNKPYMEETNEKSYNIWNI